MKEEYILKVQFYNSDNRTARMFEERGESENELRETLAKLIKDSEYRIEWQIHKTIQIASGVVEVKK